MVVYSGMLLLAVAARAAAAVPGMLLLALAARAAATVPVTNATVPLWTSNSSCEYVQLRASFPLATPPRSITVYATAQATEKLLGAYKLWVNGVALAEGPGRALSSETQLVDVVDADPSNADALAIAVQGYKQKGGGRILVTTKIVHADGTVDIFGSDAKLNAKLEANVTRALLGVSLSPGANATLKRAFDALRWDRSPKDRWDAVLTVDDFLDGCEPRLSRAAIAALGPIDWSQPLDPLRVERDAERKRLNAYFDYEGPGGISYAKFQAAVLRKVAHLDAGAVDGFVAAIAFVDPAAKPGNVTADSARALLDLVNDTAVSIEDPERWTDRRSLLDVEGPPAAASLAESIRASCVQLEAVPPLLVRAERLEDDAAELRLAAEAKLADADAAGLAADAALERARAPVAALEQRGRVLDAARETLGDPERRARYDAPCRPSRDAPGCCARALPSGGVELECAAPAAG